MRSFLLADDDSAVRFGVAELIQSLGLEVVEAGSGQEALAIVRRRSVDAALLDLHMPGDGGLEVLPKLRATRPGLPCIVYSGDLTVDLERLARDAGACDVLRKPVQPELLRRSVLRALELSPRVLPHGPH
jgi:CheY-like chemotaxis protein